MTFAALLCACLVSALVATSASGAALSASADGTLPASSTAANDAAALAPSPPPPRLILSVIIDDLGAADLGYTGSGIRTPVLDGLRNDGVTLSSFYVQPICTPSRGSYMTGRYALALGLQGKQTVQQGCTWGLDMREQTFVSALQAENVSTAMVGKVHLGADYWLRTPTFRGFDSFFGYLYGAQDYYTHSLVGGFDLRHDVRPRCGPGCSQTVGPAANGTYSANLFAARVVELVAAAGARDGPSFILFTPQSVHAPNEAPAAAVAPYTPLFPGNPIRAIHAGALAMLDEAMANITAAIAAAGLANETLIVVHSDNGGPLGPTGDGTMASNYPRRGGKHSLYEGGVRAAAFAWGPRWLPRGTTWDGLAHITDVGETLLEAAGVAPLPPLPGRPVHGTSFWQALRTGAPSARTEVIVNIDYTAAPEPQAAIVTPDGMKLILGMGGDDTCNWWSDRDGRRENVTARTAEAAASAGAAAEQQQQQQQELSASPFWPLSNMTAALYNLTADPREISNIAAEHADIVRALTARLAVWGVAAVPVVENNTADPRANPAHFNGSWTPWLGMGDDETAAAGVVA